MGEPLRDAVDATDGADAAAGWRLALRLRPADRRPVDVALARFAAGLREGFSMTMGLNCVELAALCATAGAVKLSDSVM